MDHEIPKFLIEQKMHIYQTVGNVSMTWWASSILFCASILASVWLKRDLISALPYFGLLGGVLATFFLSLVVFGVCLYVYACDLQSDLEVSLRKIHASSRSFDPELDLLKRGILDATSSFILIAGAWLVLWRSLAAGRPKKLAMRKGAKT